MMAPPLQMLLDEQKGWTGGTCESMAPLVHEISEVPPLKGSEPGERCRPDSPVTACDPSRPESLLRHDCSAALADGLVFSVLRQLHMSGGFQMLVGCRLNQHAYAQLAIYFSDQQTLERWELYRFRPSGN